MGRLQTTMWHLALALASILAPTASGVTHSLTNHTMPAIRPTFVVNYATATVICQHSSDPEDIHLHDISVLCDGKLDCFDNPAMHDESLSYCQGGCPTPTCSNKGACLHDGTNALCYCNAGWHGANCELNDTNECAVEKPCHWMAHCTNTLGSYYCTCMPGFEGDGYECNDINECLQNSTVCPSHSTCVNLPGTYFCNCTDGYIPYGSPIVRCGDIDECREGLHDCSEHQGMELCQNIEGGYECVNMCDMGYEEVGGVCQDIDECALGDYCHPRATCTNTIGGVQCECDKPLIGDGHECEAAFDCTLDGEVCDKHAYCIKPFKMCMCEGGYHGDGITCTDVNECALGSHTCRGDRKCVNIEGGFICCNPKLDPATCIKDYGAMCFGGCGANAICVDDKCQCKEGFTGDPNHRCLDIDECSVVPDVCTGPGEWCVNTLGEHECCTSDPDKDITRCYGLVIENGLLRILPRDNLRTSTTAPALITSTTSIAAPFTSTIVEPVGTLPSTDGNTEQPRDADMTHLQIDGATAAPSLNETSTDLEEFSGEVAMTDGSLAETTESIIDTDSQSADQLTEMTTASMPVEETEKHPVMSETEENTTSHYENVTDEHVLKSYSDLETVNATGEAILNEETEEYVNTEESENTTSVMPSTLQPVKIELPGDDLPNISTQPQTNIPDIILIQEVGSYEITSRPILYHTSNETEIQSDRHGRTNDTIPAISENVQTATIQSGTSESVDHTQLNGITNDTAELNLPEDTNTAVHEFGGTSQVPPVTVKAQSVLEVTDTSDADSTTQPGEMANLTETFGVEATTEPDGTADKTEFYGGTSVGPTVSVGQEVSSQPDDFPANETGSSVDTHNDQIEMSTEEPLKPEELDSSTPVSFAPTSAELDKATQIPDIGVTMPDFNLPYSDQPELDQTTGFATEFDHTTASTNVTMTSDDTTMQDSENVTSVPQVSDQETTDGTSPVTTAQTAMPHLAVSTMDTIGSIDFTASTDGSLMSTESMPGELVTDQLFESTDTSERWPLTTEAPAPDVFDTTDSLEPMSTTSTLSEESTQDMELVPDQPTGWLDSQITTGKPAAIDQKTQITMSPREDLSESTKELSNDTDTSTTSTEDVPVTTAAPGPVGTGESSASQEIEQKSDKSPAIAGETAHLPDEIPSDQPEQTDEQKLPVLQEEQLAPSGQDVLLGEDATTAIADTESTTREPGIDATTISDSSSIDGHSTTSSSIADKMHSTEPQVGVAVTTTEPESSSASELSTISSEGTTGEEITGETTVEPSLTTELTYEVTEVTDGVTEATEEVTEVTVEVTKEVTDAVTDETTESTATEATSAATEAETSPATTLEQTTESATKSSPTKLPVQGTESAVTDPPVTIEPTDKTTTKDVFTLEPEPTKATEPPVDQTETGGDKCISNDECPRDAYCERRTGACRCRPGFTDDNNSDNDNDNELVCSDVDECTLALHDCDPTAHCHNYVGGYSCRCAPGYRMEGDQCVDINECSSLLMCHPHATCTNTIGSYLCVCDEGYAGDGYTCAPSTHRPCTLEERDINECKLGRHACAENGMCVNTVGHYECLCADGFIGDGFHCEDQDECANHNSPCHPQASCSNTIGSFKCACPTGWTGDGVMNCYPAIGGEDMMMAQQTSGERNRSTCEPMMTADSVGVVDGFDDVCRMRGRSACLTLEEMAVCQCQEGFLYDRDSEQCQDIDECSEGRHTCDPVAGQCENTEGMYRCRCKKGYQGTGHLCIDIDECATHQATCDTNALCVNTVGSYLCVCNAGFSGDGRNCTKTSVRQTKCSAEGSDACARLHRTCAVADIGNELCGNCIPPYVPSEHGNDCIESADSACADESLNNCSPNATCIDLAPGKFLCSCVPGFIGDGRNCDPICPMGGRPSTDQPPCTTSNQCRIGFQCIDSVCCPVPDPTNCAYNESHCHELAQCSPSTATCICPTGFIGDGVEKCETTPAGGLDDCRVNPSLCGVHSICVEESGKCACEVGFVPKADLAHMSDGCLPLVPESREYKSCREEPSVCVENSECIDGACECKEGYIGDGDTSCTATSTTSSAEVTSPCDKCTENAICLSDVCLCKPGYIGDGQKLCVHDLDCIERVKVTGNSCDNIHASCVRMTRRCQCVEGYIGDGLTCVEHTPTTSTTTTEEPTTTSTEVESTTTESSTTGEPTTIATDESNTATTDKPTKITDEPTTATAEVTTTATTSEKTATSTTEEPTSLSTEEPATTTTGKKLTTYAVEEPTTSATSKEPITSTREKPTTSTTEKPTTSTTEKPTTTTVEPTTSTTEKPTTTTEKPTTTTEKPTTSTTEKPSTTTEEPTTSTAEKPTTTTEKPTTTTEKPTTSTTEKPTTTTEEPTTTTEKPTTSTMEKPTTTTEEPTTTTEEPTTSTTNKSTTTTEEPTTSTTEKPTTTTEKPTTTTEKPTTTTEEPTTSTTEKPTTTTEEPTTSTTEKPTTTTEEPTTSTTEKPTTTTEEPTTSTTEKPTTSTTEKPTTTTEKPTTTTEKPTTTTEEPTTSTTEKPTTSTTEKPTTTTEKPTTTTEKPTTTTEEPTTSTTEKPTTTTEEPSTPTTKKLTTTSDEPTTATTEATSATTEEPITTTKEEYTTSTTATPTSSAELSQALQLTNETSLPVMGMCATNDTCKSDEICTDMPEIRSHVCRCKRGYTRNDKGVCVDIDECVSTVEPVQCHSLARCVNIPGSFSCVCNAGYTGDGIKTCAPSDESHFANVNCGGDGLTLQWRSPDVDFEGRVFVKGQSMNQFCSKRYDNATEGVHYELEPDGQRLYRFTAGFDKCDVRREGVDTFAATIIVQRHPLFITKSSTAYYLRCTYSVGSKTLKTQFDVTMLTTIGSLVEDGPMPQCALQMLRPNTGDTLPHGLVGELLRLQLVIGPSEYYGVTPRNCKAVNMDNGQAYELTDELGCAVEPQLMPDWVRVNRSQWHVDFKIFKWPQSENIRFQCDCASCHKDECAQTVPDCREHRLAKFRQRLLVHRFRYLYKRSTNSINQIDNDFEPANLAATYPLHVDDFSLFGDNWQQSIDGDNGFWSEEPYNAALADAGHLRTLRDDPILDEGNFADRGLEWTFADDGSTAVRISALSSKLHQNAHHSSALYSSSVGALNQCVSRTALISLIVTATLALTCVISTVVCALGAVLHGNGKRQRLNAVADSSCDSSTIRSDFSTAQCPDKPEQASICERQVP